MSSNEHSVLQTLILFPGSKQCVIVLKVAVLVTICKGNLLSFNKRELCSDTTYTTHCLF